MADPTLAGRLGSLQIPTLVLWGRSDGIVDVDYGRAYAAAIPTARFRLLPDTGHSPQLETPAQVIQAIWDSTDTDFSASAR
jgi:pimeloyl-ACP methyl ester carboxylesterase